MILDIDGISIELVRKPIKSITLRIYPPDGLVKVSAPLKYSEALLRQHLQAKATWIRAQRQKMLAQPRVSKNPALITGTTLPFKGTNYLLILTEHNGPSQIKIQGELMQFYAPVNSTEEQKKQILDSWYRKEMTTVLPELITKWEKIIGVSVKQWGIKRMKTRWGSCNTRAGRIWLNLNLIEKPLICLEYVLVHELVHLLEARHNQRFYALMTQFMPDWRAHQLILERKHFDKS